MEIRIAKQNLIVIKEGNIMRTNKAYSQEVSCEADMEKMEEELVALRQVQKVEELTEDMKEKLIEKVIVYPGNRIEIA